MKKYDVFISYSSLDKKVVEGLCAYLEQQQIRCFVAYRDIPKATPWPPYIAEALNESRMMVVVFSGNFNRSEEVDRELTMASKKKMPILTFRLSDEEFMGTKEYYLSNINWIDAFPEPEKVFGAVTENVKKLIGVTDINILKLTPPMPNKNKLTFSDWILVVMSCFSGLGPMIALILWIINIILHSRGKDYLVNPKLPLYMGIGGCIFIIIILLL